MDEQALRRHLVSMLEDIRCQAQAIADDVGTVGTSDVGLGLNGVFTAGQELRKLASESEDSLARLGLDAAARSLEQQADGVMNSVLDFAFCQMVASGEDAERLRDRFGPFPMPHPDPETHCQTQHDRKRGIRSLGAQLAEFAVGLIQSIDTQESPKVQAHEARHSDDFCSVYWYGETFTFTTSQARCIEILWRHWEQLTPEIAEVTILDGASDSQRLRDVFDKGRHPAWGRMIIPGERKGRFRLAPPSD